MSVRTDAAAPDAGRRASSSGGHGTWRIYVVGYVLCILPTSLAFAVASTGLMTHDANIAAIACLAVGQMLVQLIFFVHVSTAPDSSVNIAAIIYTVVVVAVLVLGSLWIMSHLDGRMTTPTDLMRMQR